MRVVRGDGDGTAVHASITPEPRSPGCGRRRALGPAGWPHLLPGAEEGTRAFLRVWRPRGAAGSGPEVALQAVARATQPWGRWSLGLGRGLEGAEGRGRGRWRGGA